MNLELPDEETASLTQELHDIVENDRYPFSPRITTLKAILTKLRPEPVRGVETHPSRKCANKFGAKTKIGHLKLPFFGSRRTSKRDQRLSFDFWKCDAHRAPASRRVFLKGRAATLFVSHPAEGRLAWVNPVD